MVVAIFWKITLIKHIRSTPFSTISLHERCLTFMELKIDERHQVYYFNNSSQRFAHYQTLLKVANHDRIAAIDDRGYRTWYSDKRYKMHCWKIIYLHTSEASCLSRYVSRQWAVTLHRYILIHLVVR